MDVGKPGLVDNGGNAVKPHERIEAAEGSAIGCGDLHVLPKRRGVGPVLTDERTQIADTGERRGLIDVKGVLDVAVERREDEQVTHGSKRVQG